MSDCPRASGTAATTRPPRRAQCRGGIPCRLLVARRRDGPVLPGGV